MQFNHSEDDRKIENVFKYEVTMATSHVCEYRGKGGLEINKPFI